MVLKIEMVKEPKLDKVPDFSLIFPQIWRFLPNQIRDQYFVELIDPIQFIYFKKKTMDVC